MSGPGERHGERFGERQGEGVTDCAVISEGRLAPGPDDAVPDKFPPPRAAAPPAPEAPNLGSTPAVVLRRLMERGGCLQDFLPDFRLDVPLSKELCKYNKYLMAQYTPYS